MSSLVTEASSPSEVLFPPHDKDSPSFHFWTIIVRDRDIAAGMRNGGKWAGFDVCMSSLLKPKDPNADPGRPCSLGYEYDHSTECTDGTKYGCWVRLSDDCRRRLLTEYRGVEKLDAKMEKMKQEGKKLKAVSCSTADPAMEGAKCGGADTQIPISIDEYVYFNYVQNRLPMGLEKGFQIKARKAGVGDWAGKVPHLTGQEFYWRQDAEDCVKVQFGKKDWTTWENEVTGIPGCKFFGDVVEFPTTHLWVDFDKYEMVWMYNKVAVARKVMEIPWIIKKPVDWAIGYGLKRLEKGEGYVEGEEAAGAAK